MSKTYTLKELADIGVKHAHSCLNGNLMQCNSSVNAYDFVDQENARLAFTQAILDAIGYELPKDEEREAFSKWWQTSNLHAFCNAEDAFKVWKAGREELRKAMPMFFSTENIKLVTESLPSFLNKP